MKIKWERARLKFYHLIGRVTRNYSLENRLRLFRMKEEWDAKCSIDVIGILAMAVAFVTFPIIIESMKLPSPVLLKLKHILRSRFLRVMKAYLIEKSEALCPIISLNWLNYWGLAIKNWGASGYLILLVRKPRGSF